MPPYDRNSVATNYEEFTCYYLLDTVPRLDDGAEVVQPKLQEPEFFRLLRALGVVDADAASPEDQLGHFINACLHGYKARWYDDAETVSKYSIDVVACYGKQAAVEADLRTQGWWPTHLETHLHPSHEGVHAILLPETSDRPKLVLFTWLLDPSFSPKYLRERATYALRFLTTLTPTVRVCLSDDDWGAVEHAYYEARVALPRGLRSPPTEIRGVACKVASTATTAPGETLVVATCLKHSHVHFQNEYLAGGATMLTMTPVGGAPLGRIQLPRDAVVVDVAFVTDPRTVVIIVFTCDGKTHVQSFQANEAQPMTPLVAKAFPKLVERCDFDMSHRLLALLHSDTNVDIFAFSESFKVFERVEQFNLQGLRLWPPYASMFLFGGANHGLFVVGSDGSAHSYYLRSRQQPKLLPAFAMPGTKVVKLQNGSCVVCVEPLGNEDDDQHPCRLRLHALEIQSHEMMPLVTEVALPKALNWSTVQARAYDDAIVLLDQSSGDMVVLKMTIVTGRVGFEADTEAPVPARERHVLAAFFHVFEKFPVRAFMTRGDDDDDDDSDDSDDEDAAKSKPGVKCSNAEHLPMALQLHMQASTSTRRKAAESVLKAIVKKLKILGKDLAALSLTNNPVVNGDLVWPTMALGRWVFELVGCVPVPICRARDNELELLRDGNVVTPSQCTEVHQLKRQILFGPTSYILKAWRGPVLTVTSMGQHSTGKSYFLNHLTGSSFAISRTRCTDGVSLTLRPYGDTLVVVLDFEGLGSFERSKQEDTLLSVLNAAISQLTIFRIGLRSFDKDIDATFASLQQGVTLLKGDERLFSGHLCMNVKDVNPDDIESAINAVRTKLQSCREYARADSFLTVMYGGTVHLTASEPPSNVGYYHGLVETSTCLAKARDRKTFSSGADFHECLAFVLAKIALRDWSTGDNNPTGWTAWLREQLRYALRYGELNAASTAATTDIWADDDDAMMLQRQEMGLADVVVPRDAEIDFGLAFDGPRDTVANISMAKATLLHYLGRYVQLTAASSHNDDYAGRPRHVTVPRRSNHEAGFDVLWKYILWRREYRVRAWLESLGGASNQALHDDFNNCVQTVKQLLRRCEHTCSECKLGCFESSLHDTTVPHDCGGSHRCEGHCAHCDDNAPCGAPAGHVGSCNCRKKSHTCPQKCHLAAARNCDGNYHLDVNHVGPHLQRRAAPLPQEM